MEPTINDRKHQVDVPADMPLLWVLDERGPKTAQSRPRLDPRDAEAKSVMAPTGRSRARAVTACASAPPFHVKSGNVPRASLPLHRPPASSRGVCFASRAPLGTAATFR